MKKLLSLFLALALVLSLAGCTIDPGYEPDLRSSAADRHRKPTDEGVPGCRC